MVSNMIGGRHIYSDDKKRSVFVNSPRRHACLIFVQVNPGLATAVWVKGLRRSGPVIHRLAARFSTTAVDNFVAGLTGGAPGIRQIKRPADESEGLLWWSYVLENV